MTKTKSGHSFGSSRRAGMVVLSLGLCLILSMTKGWDTLILFPATLVIAFPFEILLQAAGATVVQMEAASRFARLLPGIQLALLMVFYAFLPGFEDGPGATVFGFVHIDNDSVLNTFQNISFASLGLSVVAATILISLRITRGRGD